MDLENPYVLLTMNITVSTLAFVTLCFDLAHNKAKQITKKGPPILFNFLFFFLYGPDFYVAERTL